MDRAEAIVEEETRRLFALNDEYGVNAQPHTATQANHAVFRAILGDEAGTVTGLAPSDGGHISHRFGVPSPHDFIPFRIDAGGIDYDRLTEFVAVVRPTILVAGGSSYTRGIEYERLRSIADLVGAHLHADLAHTAPFVATGLHPAAFPFVDSATLDPSKNLRGSGGGILVYRRRDEPAMQRAVFPILQSAPSQAGLIGKAVCLTYWSLPELTEYAARMVRIARTLSDRLADELGDPIFGTTESHLLLFDVSSVCEDGRDAEERLEQARILANRNQVPGDDRPPWAPSGIRLSSTVPSVLQYESADVEVLAQATVLALRSDLAALPLVEHLLETYHRPIVGSVAPMH